MGGEHLCSQVTPVLSTSHTCKEEDIADPTDVCAQYTALLAWPLDGVQQFVGVAPILSLALQPLACCAAGQSGEVSITDAKHTSKLTA